MVSVNKLNVTFAELRGVPVATVETYSRVLRKEGVLPATTRGSGATKVTPLHAAYMLIAIMRGSPTAAAANAREIGGLIIHDGGLLNEGVLTRQLHALDWQDSITFAEAIAWVIGQLVDGRMSRFADLAKGMEAEIDRYWTAARLSWLPVGDHLQALIAGNMDAAREIYASEADTEAKAKDLMRRLLDLTPSGAPARGNALSFHSPHLYEAKISYKVDPARNAAAHAAFRATKDEANKHDVWGTEKVTLRTLAALADLFRASRPAGGIDD